MEKRQVLGILSALMLLGGVFAPAVTLGLPLKIRWISFPLQGSVSYFQYTATLGNNEWFMVVGLAGLAIVLAVLKMCLGLLFTSITSGGIVAFTIIDFQQKAALLLHPFSDSVAARITQVTDVLAAFFIQFSWGSMLLVAGPVLMFAAALMPRERRPRYHAQSHVDPTIVCSRCQGTNYLRHNYCAHCAAPLRAALSSRAASYQSTPGGQVPLLTRSSRRPPPHG